MSHCTRHNLTWREPPGEEGDHPCPRCEYDPPEREPPEDERDNRPAVIQAAKNGLSAVEEAILEFDPYARDHAVAKAYEVLERWLNKLEE